MRFIEGEPPKPAREWGTIAAELREHPEQWAEIEENPDRNGYDRTFLAKASYITKGKSPHMPKGEFEAMVRGTKLYARYVGSREKAVTIR